MIEVPLNRGVALVDDEDVSLVESRWYISSHGYVRRTTDDAYLHRLVMRAAKGEEIDHVSGDKLDNRRANLRFATRSMQMQNAETKNGIYRNVYRRRDGMYYGQIRVGKKRHHTYPSADREKVREDVAELRKTLLPFARYG